MKERERSHAVMAQVYNNLATRALSIYYFKTQLVHYYTTFTVKRERERERERHIETKLENVWII